MCRCDAYNRKNASRPLCKEKPNSLLREKKTRIKLKNEEGLSFYCVYISYKRENTSGGTKKKKLRQQRYAFSLFNFTPALPFEKVAKCRDCDVKVVTFILHIWSLMKFVSFFKIARGENSIFRQFFTRQGQREKTTYNEKLKNKSKFLVFFSIFTIHR